jgi:hypothetical protein
MDEKINEYLYVEHDVVAQRCVTAGRIEEKKRVVLVDKGGMEVDGKDGVEFEDEINVDRNWVGYGDFKWEDKRLEEKVSKKLTSTTKESLEGKVSLSEEVVDDNVYGDEGCSNMITLSLTLLR